MDFSSPTPTPCLSTWEPRRCCSTASTMVSSSPAREAQVAASPEGEQSSNPSKDSSLPSPTSLSSVQVLSQVQPLPPKWVRVPLRFKSSLRQPLPPRWVQAPLLLAKPIGSMMVSPLLPALDFSSPTSTPCLSTCPTFTFQWTSPHQLPPPASPPAPWDFSCLSTCLWG